MFAIVFKIIIK